MMVVVLVLVFLSVAVSGWALLPDASRRLVRQRIYSEVSTTKRPSPLSQLVQWLTPINRRLPTGWYCERMTKVLEAAGRRMPPLQFLVVQEIGAVTGAIVYVAMWGTGPFKVGLLAVCLVVGFFIPVHWLNQQIHARRMTISRDLPEVVD